MIAVLPFRNRSVREEDAYFTAGIHDDLLTQLSRIAAFKVISRTSMMRYQDSDKSVPEIARELSTENLFAIEADIAKPIADSMKMALSPAEVGALAAGSTRNLQAYEAFLRGKLGSTADGATAEKLGAAIPA